MTSEKLWANGEAAWDAIRTADEALVQRFDDWTFQPEELNTNYRLRIERYREIPQDQDIRSRLSRESWQQHVNE